MTEQSYYFDEILSLIPNGSKVLDLGCGSGELLKRLIDTKEAIGHGIDHDPQCVISAIGQGLSVTQQDLNNPLPGFGNQTYDFVILSRTLQMVINPLLTVQEMLRIGRQGIVILPNFGYWQVRFRLLFSGKMPKSARLPYEWYNTPNIHLSTIADFRTLCRAEHIRIVKEIPLLGSLPKPLRSGIFANLLAEEGLFVIQADPI